ncbi:MAG TPA: hypothetical protein VNV16_15720 [Methylibium sp.]|jgi:hypothetical protein|nr:hypothetical protein [Methylibium sp.]
MNPCFARRCGAWLAGVLLAFASAAAPCSEWQGLKTVTLHGRDGRQVVIGTLRFEPRDDGAVAFSLDIDRSAMQDHFLSMREFKCAEGDTELLCHVPYPYAQPSVVRGGDYRWLEHALLFLYKQPRDFGAKLRNGLYFRLEPAARGLIGTPQAIDLTVIGVPPDDLSLPPYVPALRDEIAEGSRWVTRLTIE